MRHFCTTALKPFVMDNFQFIIIIYYDNFQEIVPEYIIIMHLPDYLSGNANAISLTFVKACVIIIWQAQGNTCCYIAFK